MTDAPQTKPSSEDEVRAVNKSMAARPARSRLRAWLPGLLFLAVLVTATYVIWRLFFASSREPDNVITLSGRIEGDSSAIAAKFSGRILEVRFREGDTVNAGDTIALLDDEQIRAREDQARAAVADAESRLQAAQAQIAVLQEELRQSQLLTEQAQTDAAGRVRQANSEVTAAEADLAKQEAAYKLAA